MKPSPLKLTSIDDGGRRLMRIQSTPNDPKNEAWLQELLFARPELLPVEAFDDACAPPVPIGREVRTDRGPIDNLYVSPEGGVTIVETKLWKNPEKHRTVVAQVIDYAKELATWDYDQLCEAVLASSRSRGETETASLEEKMAAPLAQVGLPLHEFQESVAERLAGGEFLLLIVGDRISPNIALLTKAIQSAPGLAFNLGLVEMQIYELSPDADWPLIVVPEVVGRTVEKTRGVVQVRYRQERPDVSVEMDEEGDEQATAPAGKLNMELFLSQLPRDLVAPFEEGIEAWRAAGGDIRFTRQTLFLECEIGEERLRVIRCKMSRINLIRRRDVEEWGGDSGLYEAYLADLEAAPAALRAARDGRMWIGYDQLSADELRTLLRAARELVGRLVNRGA